jgi:ferritin-like metal-binding protein YciE
MTPSQSKRLENILKVVQDLRRSLDKEAAHGMTGVGANFGTEIDINDAIFGIVYTEKALCRIWEREAYVRTLTPATKARIRINKDKPMER